MHMYKNSINNDKHIRYVNNAFVSYYKCLLYGHLRGWCYECIWICVYTYIYVHLRASYVRGSAPYVYASLGPVLYHDDVLATASTRRKATFGVLKYSQATSFVIFIDV